MKNATNKIIAAREYKVIINYNSFSKAEKKHRTQTHQKLQHPITNKNKDSHTHNEI